jgi:hypothetical protein
MPLTRCNIVHAYAPPLAPIGKGKSNCPPQFGRKPGLIAEPAPGFIFAGHLPVGNPRAARYGLPLVDKVQTAFAHVPTRPTPAIHSRAGALALTDAQLRTALHTRGILTVGSPHTVEPLAPPPPPAAVHQLLTTAGVARNRTPRQVQLAGTAGYRRPVVESSMGPVCCLRGRPGCATKGGTARTGKSPWRAWLTTRPLCAASSSAA